MKAPNRWCVSTAASPPRRRLHPGRLRQPPNERLVGPAARWPVSCRDPANEYTTYTVFVLPLPKCRCYNALSLMSTWFAAALDLVLHKWDSRGGLIAALSALLFVLLTTFAGVDITKVQAVEWAIMLLSCLLLSFLWWRNRLPVVPKGKVGFGVAITFERSDHAQQLRSDFVLTLRDLIARSQLGQRFHFVEFRESTARGIVTSDDAKTLAQRCNLHFLLHGRARHRTLPRGTVHVLDLSGLVRHARIKPAQSKQFSADFAAVLPHRLTVDSDAGILPCEFAAEHIDAVSRYVIGTAAIFSSDFILAEQLLLGAESRLQRMVKVAEGTPPAVLLDRVRKRIQNLYTIWLDTSGARYKKSRDTVILHEVHAVCNKLRPYDPTNYGLHVVSALVAFLLHRDTELARRELEACHNLTDAAWRYSEAFLHAYEGDLHKAYRSYRIAFRSPLHDPTVPIQCEEFIQEILDEEPRRNWLYYCLGLINYKAKSDLEAALRDFGRFVDSADPSVFRREVHIVKKWMKEIVGRRQRV